MVCVRLYVKCLRHNVPSSTETKEWDFGFDGDALEVWPRSGSEVKASGRRAEDATLSCEKVLQPSCVVTSSYWLQVFSFAQIPVIERGLLGSAHESHDETEGIVTAVLPNCNQESMLDLFPDEQTWSCPHSGSQSQYPRIRSGVWFCHSWCSEFLLVSFRPRVSTLVSFPFCSLRFP